MGLKDQTQETKKTPQPKEQYSENVPLRIVICHTNFD
jgi:hypothetical protein